MLPVSILTDMSDYGQYAIWLIAITVVAFGFRYAKEIIAFMLDKFYQFFILNTPVHVKNRITICETAI